jgi:hypothetical protein
MIQLHLQLVNLNMAIYYHISECNKLAICFCSAALRPQIDSLREKGSKCFFNFPALRFEL